MNLRSRPLNKAVQSFKRAVSVEKWEGVGNQISWSYGINTWQRSGCGKCGLLFKKFDKRMTAWSVLFWKKTPQCLWTKCKELVERKGINDRVNFQVGIHAYLCYLLIHSFIHVESTEQCLGTQMLEPNGLGLSTSSTVTALGKLTSICTCLRGLLKGVNELIFLKHVELYLVYGKHLIIFDK